MDASAVCVSSEFLFSASLFCVLAESEVSVLSSESDLSVFSAA